MDYVLHFPALMKDLSKRALPGNDKGNNLFYSVIPSNWLYSFSFLLEIPLSIIAKLGKEHSGITDT
jgi:hypothetical protein